MSILRQYILIVTIVITPVSLFSYSLQDELAVVKTLAIMIQRGWNDCPIVRGETVDDLPEESVALPLFQTYNDLFAYGFPTGEVGSGWSKYEKRAAFEHFIDMIPELSTNKMYRAIDLHGGIAIRFCHDHGITNILPSAMRIIASPHAVASARRAALAMFKDFAVPNDIINKYIESVLNNAASEPSYWRSYIRDAYSTVLYNNIHKSSPLSLTNGIALVRSFVNGADGAIAVDHLLLATYPKYEISSNRLVIANEALMNNHSHGIWSPIAIIRYFTPITNQLLNATQPLVQLSLP